jgi:septum formation inhibitor MinC
LKIETCIYTGEKSRYSFETHISIFKKAHLDLQKAGNEPDGRTKVRKFLQSVKAPELQTAVGVARSQDKYLTDFEETVNYLRRYVLPTSANRTMALVGARTHPPQQPAGLSYRWYKKEEFRALPKEHQTWLSYEKRRRDQLNKRSGKMEKNKIKAAVRKEKRKLAKQAKTDMASKKVRQGGDDRNDYGTDVE